MTNIASKPIRRLKIGIDIDGVLADIVQQILPLLGRECGRPITHSDINCYTFSKALNLPEERVHELMTEVVTNGHFEAAPIVPGAVEGLTRLSYHRLYLITSRPDDAREQTKRWLSRHDVPHDRLMFAPALAKARNGDGFDLFIEDHLEAALGLAQEGILVLLFDWPWNRNGTLSSNIHRVHNWSEIVAAVERQAYE